MFFCRHCAAAQFTLDLDEPNRLVLECRYGLEVSDEPHQCPQYEREPGSDDDA